jgi:hypothetical protein
MTMHLLSFDIIYVMEKINEKQNHASRKGRERGVFSSDPTKKTH